MDNRNSEARLAAVSGLLAAVLVVALTAMALSAIPTDHTPQFQIDAGFNADTQGR